MMRICTRCGSATVDVPPVAVDVAEVAVTSGSGWSTRTRRLVLCGPCLDQFEDWLVMPQDHHAIGGALASTAVASMALHGVPA